MMNEIRLLILEEHKEVRHALQVRLQSSSNFKVVAAYSSRADWKGQRPSLADCSVADVVLLGLKSSRHDSFNLIVQDIEKFKQKDTAVIVLASVANAYERELVLQAGAQRYLLKDINSMQLIAEIEALAAENIV